MRNPSDTYRAIVAALVAAVAIAAGRVPAADAAAAPHINAGNHAAHALTPARERCVVRPRIQLVASPAPTRRPDRRPCDGNAMGADSPSTSLALTGGVAKERHPARRAAHGRAVISGAGDGPSIASALFVASADVDDTAPHAVFHDAHAPPLRS